jgi:hypothetical protein
MEEQEINGYDTEPNADHKRIYGSNYLNGREIFVVVQTQGLESRLKGMLQVETQEDKTNNVNQ